MILGHNIDCTETNIFCKNKTHRAAVFFEGYVCTVNALSLKARLTRFEYRQTYLPIPIITLIGLV